MRRSSSFPISHTGNGDSAMEPIHRSRSAQDSQSDSDGLAMTLNVSTTRDQQEQQQQDTMNLNPVSYHVNDISPTSIYTTESEIPFDEKADRMAKIQHASGKPTSRTNNAANTFLGFTSLFRTKHPETTSDRDNKQSMADSNKMNDTDSVSQEDTEVQPDMDTIMLVKSSDSTKHSNDPFGDDQPTTSSVVESTVCCSYWTWLSESVLHAGIKRFTIYAATKSARNPFTVLITMTVASLAVLGIGFFTNFQLIVDSDIMFTPTNALAVQHHDWLVHDSGFNVIRPLIMILHSNGDNVLGKKELDQLFQAVDEVRQTPGYNDICERGTFVSYDGIHTCQIYSATRFWNHNYTAFREQVKSDEDAIDILSKPTYADGMTPVFHELLLGNYRMNNSTLHYTASNQSFTTTQHEQRLHFVQSYFVRFEFPDVGPESDDLEERVLKRLEHLKAAWEEEVSSTLELDVLSIYAYQIENQRALMKDLPLVLGIFLVLFVSTTVAFSKPHPVFSRSMLGIGSLAAIGMSLAMSYGLMWCIGIPFTNVAQILPFMIMGIGLDDTFIIMGCYFRTNPNHSVAKRMETTMNEIGIAITLTSVTTAVAFLLGTYGNIPAINWLSWYAFAAIVMDYLFQLTFFVALVALDEKRLQAYRRNWCFWQTVKVDLDDCESQMGVILSSSDMCDNNDDDEEPRLITETGSHSHFSEHIMVWYSNQLMKPYVKLLVVLVFSAFFAFCTYRATLLTQEFNVEDYTVRTHGWLHQATPKFFLGEEHYLIFFVSLPIPT